MGIEKLFNEYYKNKNVLVTGHTGFKGSWLSLVLYALQARVTGYALKPYTPQDNFVLTGLDKKIHSIIADVRDHSTLNRVFRKYQPEIVFHLAAQPLVKRSYHEPKDTLDTNIGGTVNVLECARQHSSVKVIIIVTSDKCYKIKRNTAAYTENHELGGDDPYSASKSCAEIIAHAYLKSYGFNNEHKALSTVRAGNVIGGGDWQQDRLVPDCIKALENGQAIILRNPEFVRPWQYVLEPLLGYLLLAYKMALDPRKYSAAWNFGPSFGYTLKVKDLAAMLIKQWGYGEMSLQDVPEAPEETAVLLLDSTKAAQDLNWQALLTPAHAVRLTVEWYKNYKTNNCFELAMTQIEAYVDRFKKAITI